MFIAIYSLLKKKKNPILAFFLNWNLYIQSLFKTVFTSPTTELESNHQAKCKNLYEWTAIVFSLFEKYVLFLLLLQDFPKMFRLSLQVYLF